MNSKSFLKLVTSIVVTELAGIIGAVFTTPAITTWYATLNKPSFNPPSWLFGPVWTTLFLLMGISAFLIWNKGWGRSGVRKALDIFLLQLVFNIAWSIIFFGLHSPVWAFVYLVILWLGIAWAIVAFHKISKPAAYLLLPYIVWVTFAGILNYAIWMLN